MLIIMAKTVMYVGMELQTVQSATSCGNNRQRSNTRIPDRNTVLIASLRLYSENVIPIKVRVTKKSEIIASNWLIPSKSFTMELCDGSGEIKVQCYNDLADKFFTLIEVRLIYKQNGNACY